MRPGLPVPVVDAVSDSQITFRWTTYRNLWEEWTAVLRGSRRPQRTKLQGFLPSRALAPWSPLANPLSQCTGSIVRSAWNCEARQNPHRFPARAPPQDRPAHIQFPPRRHGETRARNLRRRARVEQGCAGPYRQAAACNSDQVSTCISAAPMAQGVSVPGSGTILRQLAVCTAHRLPEGANGPSGSLVLL